MICGACLEPCQEKVVDDGFYYEWGSERGWHDDRYIASDCCHDQILDGTLWLDKCSTHTARKDHVNDEGRVEIRKGQTYRAYLKKGFYVEGGEHKPIYEYHKQVL